MGPLNWWSWRLSFSSSIFVMIIYSCLTTFQPTSCVLCLSYQYTTFRYGVVAWKALFFFKGRARRSVGFRSTQVYYLVKNPILTNLLTTPLPGITRTRTSAVHPSSVSVQSRSIWLYLSKVACHEGLHLAVFLAWHGALFLSRVLQPRTKTVKPKTHPQFLVFKFRTSRSSPPVQLRRAGNKCVRCAQHTHKLIHLSGARECHPSLRKLREVQ